MMLRKSVVAWGQKVEEGTASCKKKTAGNFGVIEIFYINDVGGLHNCIKLSKLIRLDTIGKFYCMQVNKADPPSKRS